MARTQLYLVLACASAVSLFVLSVLCFAVLRTNEQRAVESKLAPRIAELLTVVEQAERGFTPEEQKKQMSAISAYGSREFELMKKYTAAAGIGGDGWMIDDPKIQPIVDRVKQDLKREFGTERTPYSPILKGKLVTFSQKTGSPNLELDSMYFRLSKDRSARSPDEIKTVVVVRPGVKSGPIYRSSASDATFESSQDTCLLRGVDVATKKVIWEQSFAAPTPSTTHRASPSFKLDDSEIIHRLNHYPHSD